MEQRNTTDIKADKWSQINAVLIIDDDVNWCFIAKKIFQKAGYGKEVLTATNGLAAYEKLQAMTADGEDLPELIFLDIKMPIMDGYGFLDEVMKSEHLDLSRSKIYICSSSFLPKDKERAKQYTIDGFITKPLTREMLNNIIE